MEAKKFDQDAIYNLYNSLLKAVLNLQTYMLQKHIDTGLLVAFPDLRLPSLLQPKVTQQAQDAQLFDVRLDVPVEKQFDVYVNIYVQALKANMKSIRGKDVTIMSFEKAKETKLTWRTYMDLVIKTLSEAMSE